MLIKRARGRSASHGGESPEISLFDLRVSGERIAEIAENLEALPGETVLDLAGAFLTLGMVDAHVHFELGEGDPAAATLASGTLAVRSLGAAGPRTEAARPGAEAAGPRTEADPEGDSESNAGRDRKAQTGAALLPAQPPLVRNAGRALAPPRGYGGFLGRRLEVGEVLREAVTREADRGAQVIKVIVSGAVDFDTGEAEGPYVTAHSLAEAVEVAREYGLSVAAHANGAAAVSLAAEAGVASIEHGIGLGESELASLAKRGVAWVPTLTPLYLLGQGKRGASAHERRPGADNDSRGVDEARVDDCPPPPLHDVLGRHVAAVARGRELGARILCGTDAGSPWVPHGSIGIELDLLARAGFHPDELAVLATAETGRLLGIEGFRGLRPGCPAMLAWFASDPFEPSSGLPVRRRALGVVWGEQVVFEKDA